VIQLDQEAADFLLEDGLVLHEESAAVRSYSLLLPVVLLLAVLMQSTPLAVHQRCHVIRTAFASSMLALHRLN
jgi:hypothetical protein